MKQLIDDITQNNAITVKSDVTTLSRRTIQALPAETTFYDKVSVH